MEPNNVEKKYQENNQEINYSECYGMFDFVLSIVFIIILNVAICSEVLILNIYSKLYTQYYS